MSIFADETENFAWSFWGKYVEGNEGGSRWKNGYKGNKPNLDWDIENYFTPNYDYFKSPDITPWWFLQSMAMLFIIPGIIYYVEKRKLVRKFKEIEDKFARIKAAKKRKEKNENKNANRNQNASTDYNMLDNESVVATELSVNVSEYAGNGLLLENKTLYKSITE